MSSSSSSAIPSSIENGKFELLVKKRLLEREEFIQELLKKEDTIRHLERCSMQYLYEHFFPDVPLGSSSDILRTPDVTCNDVGHQDDETVFFSTGNTHFSFLTRWNLRGYGMFLTSTDRYNNVLQDAVPVNAANYFFDTPVFYRMEDGDEVVEERDGAIFSNRDVTHHLFPRLYRSLEDTPTILPSAGDDVLTSVMHVGLVPWKLVTMPHEEGMTGVMFQNLHEPEVKCRYILHEGRRFLPCMLEGVHYYVVASERECYSDLVRFTDNKVVKSFFTGGNPRQVICCTGYLVVVSNSLEDGLVNVFTLYLAP